MQQDSHAWHPVVPDDAIRLVFLSPQPFYSPQAAAALLGWTPREMETAIREGALDAERTCSGWRIGWEAVASALVDQQSLREVEAALGEQASTVLPELCRLGELRVALPRWQTLMLARLAKREQLDAGDFLARHLLDLAAAESDWLAEAIPGFDAAVAWPVPPA